MRTSKLILPCLACVSHANCFRKHPWIENTIQIEASTGLSQGIGISPAKFALSSRRTSENMLSMLMLMLNDRSQAWFAPSYRSFLAKIPFAATVFPIRRWPILMTETVSDGSTPEPAEIALKRLKAERLALEAERAALQAEQLELEASQLDEAFGIPPPPPPPASNPEDELMALRSPLRWIGPYPALAISLPDLQTPKQKARELSGGGSAKGVTLDFVIDTAANINSINAQVAGPTVQGGLELTQIGTVESSLGAGGRMPGGMTYMLGDIELADVPKAERVRFMSGVSATALSAAGMLRGAAGLFGVTFLNSFPGGVEFQWSRQDEPGLVPDSLTFYGSEAGTAKRRANLSAVPVRPLPETALPSVMLSINDIEIPALLDTGSPITILNAAAAEAVGLQDVGLSADATASNNPFARIGASIQQITQRFKAAQSGDSLMMAGENGLVQLLRAPNTTVKLGPIAFGDDCRPYVGELPGLSRLDGLGADVGPAAILGTDVLRRRSQLWYTPTCIYL